MSIVEAGSMGARLTKRVRAILTAPATTWDEIEQEPASLAGLYLTYVMPLAAIGPVAGFIGAVVFGNPKDGVAFRPPVPAYKHSAAMFLKLRGWIACDSTHPASPQRPDSDRATLKDILDRLDALTRSLA